MLLGGRQASEVETTDGYTPNSVSVVSHVNWRYSVVEDPASLVMVHFSAHEDGGCQSSEMLTTPQAWD